MRCKVSSYLSLHFLLLIIFIQTLYGCEVYRFVATDDGKALAGHVIDTITKSLVAFCWGDCVWLSWCFSINVRQTSDGMFECELNNSSKKANPSKMASKEGWSYHEMKGVSNINCKTNECKRKEDLGNGWFRYGDAATKLFTDKKNWTEARSHCQSLGGDLLSITSSHENDFVNDVFVHNLNLTDIQQDTKSSFVHYKLDGEDSDIKLLGVQGDATYVLDGKEKALHLKSTGEAEIPSITVNPEVFTLCFWMKILDHRADSFVFGLFKNTTNIVKVYFGTNFPQLKLQVNGHFIAGIRLQFDASYEICTAWVKSTKTVSFGRKKSLKTVTDTITSIDTSGEITARFGESANNMHGFFKQFVLVNSAISNLQEMEAVKYFNDHGAWIGLNNPEGSAGFSWSDGTPVGQFMNLPDYNPQPKETGRKCVAIAKDKKWLDKHCDSKYPFLCEKQAPP